MGEVKITKEEASKIHTSFDASYQAFYIALSYQQLSDEISYDIMKGADGSYVLILGYGQIDKTMTPPRYVTDYTVIKTISEAGRWMENIIRKHSLFPPLSIDPESGLQYDSVEEEGKAMLLEFIEKVGKNENND